jgi:hypothetical protein
MHSGAHGRLLIAALSSLFLLLAGTSHAAVSAEFPRWLDARHEHAAGTPRNAYVTLRHGDAVLRQAMIGACGRLHGVPRGGVGYLEAFRDVDVFFQPRAGLLKEIVLLGSAGAARSAFTYWVAATEGGDELTAVASPNRSVAFVDGGGRKVFELIPPFVYDAAGATSKDVAVELDRGTFRGQAGYLVTVRIPRSWLSDPARRFPVALDPTTLVSEICVKVDFSGGCNIYHPPTQGPDVPGYANLSVPQLTEEMIACALPPDVISDPVIGCDIEGLVPDTTEPDIGTCAPGISTQICITPTVAKAAYAGSARAVAAQTLECPVIAYRPRRSPPLGFAGPYFVKGKAKGGCIGAGIIMQSTITACLVRDNNGRGAGGELVLACNSRSGGSGTRTVRVEWCCYPGRYYYKIEAFATGVTVLGARDVGSHVEDAYSLKPIRC